MIVKKIPFLLFVFTYLLQAQDGTRVYEFLNITSSPRQAALGGNAQSVWDSDPNMALWNPALMNDEMHLQLAINYTSYLADLTFGNTSVVYALDDENYISLHAQYLDYGTFNGFDVIGNPTNTFTAQDAALTVGYARKLNDFFTVGANVKYINSTIEQFSSSAIAADFGIVFHDIDYDTNVSFVIRNLGYQLQAFDQKKEELPMQINLGVSHQLEYVPLEFSLTFKDLQQFNSSEPFNENGQETSVARKFIDHVSVGAELFPEKAFNLRIGYNFKRGNELTVDGNRNFTGLTYGFGLRVHAFKFEYAFAGYHAASNSNHFGVSVNLDRLLSGRDYYRYYRTRGRR